MPQEIALYGEFSIKETMMYFGWIFGMKTSEIVQRLQFLLNFLDLPSQNRLVKNLSGGQQRRVSFAVALMHDPELLILDEPTVGVDPLLRQSIWNHLVHITKAGQKTVIITTHYIEEARQAHTVRAQLPATYVSTPFHHSFKFNQTHCFCILFPCASFPNTQIGLMRSGRLLAEESPSALLATYRCKNLEDVFLQLSRKQGTTNAVNELNISNLSLSALAFGNKKDAPVYISQDSGVVGLNFHQSKEVLITDYNGSANGVSNPKHHSKLYMFTYVCRFPYIFLQCFFVVVGLVVVCVGIIPKPITPASPLN